MEQLKRKFIWNKHGVCTNPEVRMYSSSRAYVKVKLAKHKNKWYYATSFKVTNPTEESSRKYGGYLPSLRFSGCSKKSEAIFKAYIELEHDCIDDPLLMEVLRRCKNEILQLSLFDNA